MKGLEIVTSLLGNSKTKGNGVKKNGMMTNKEIQELMQSEVGPNGKVLFLALAFSGGVDVNPYRAGDAYRLHPYEIHQGLSDLKHRKLVLRGEVQDCLTLVRKKK